MRQFKILLIVQFVIFFSAYNVHAENGRMKVYQDSLAKVSSFQDSIFLLNRIAWFMATDKPKEALVIAKKSIEIGKNHNFSEDLDKSYTMVGVAFDFMGKYDSALFYHLKAYRLAEEQKDSIVLGEALTNTSIILMFKNQFESSLSYLIKAEKVYKAIGDKYGLTTIYVNKAIVLYELGRNDEVRLNYKLAARYAEKEKYYDLLPMVLTNLAELDFDEGYVYRAIGYQEKSVEHFREVQDNYSLCEALIRLSNYHTENKSFSEAKKCLKEVETIAIEGDYLNLLSELYESYSNLYDQQGLPQKALESYRKHVAYRDSMNLKKMNEEIAKQKEQFEAEKREQAIRILEKDKKLAHTQIELKNKEINILGIIIGAAILLILLILILVFVLVRSNRIKKQKNKLILSQKEEVEAQRDQIDQQKNIIEEKHSEIQESITYAKRIQMAILPEMSDVLKYLPDSFVFYKPKDIVAGDFYWVYEKEGTVFFAVADCTGHGVPGAMVSVVCYNALNRCVREYDIDTPGKILDKVRELVVEAFLKSEDQVKDGMDICLCAWNKNNKEFQYAGANNSLYVIKDQSLNEIKATKQPIGYVQDPVPFINHQIDLSQVDYVYLYSDGFADQFGGPKKKKYNYKNFRKLLASIYGLSPEKQQEKLNKELDLWLLAGGEEQIDDICVFGVKLN